MVYALLPGFAFKGEKWLLARFRDWRQLEEVTRDNNLRIASSATVPRHDECVYLNPTKRLVSLLAKLEGELRECIEKLAVDH